MDKCPARVVGSTGIVAQNLACHALVEPDVTRLASWWRTDGDLGRTIQCVNDLGKSRCFGILQHRDTLQAFPALCSRLVHERLIPG